ncbi:family 43 glycosylhydrolase [Gracilimonas mengyeensis]|uniref:Por secretion system C-terminal sorting domain-containing protein n=1 Tax=Gracilimonas mengyeensis TaxID=1302730 RepID=A0A521AYA3_9BACT|nr:family 43 glycosylhydrolase [Gracilimonas mengyeensis]SMO39818.1 Por secretion system C-terminal sorting domain-containing protein [Gracilimonas mengyeensis]
MIKKILLIVCAGILAFLSFEVHAQSPSFDTYVNPIIPGDHPDPTLTKIGDYFYTSGSSFNPTPKIYRSTDLVHWEVIAQPVSPTWSVYGDNAGGGIWGGHMVWYNDSYWHFFGRGGGSMYYVKADEPEGPWSEPVRVEVPDGISALGVDNSIFIDEEYGKWYLLAKHGRENNHIVELNDEGQPTGEILDLTWMNPDAEDNPYGWAEGPVMWKRDGWYYYSVAQHLAGVQYVMKSDTLSDDPEDWTIKDGGMQYGTRYHFNTPNHISPAVQLDDGTSWVIGHSYHQDWVTQGRQGLLLEITYDEEGFPVFQYPQDSATDAPDLPSGGTPWMVPKSDMFNSETLDPEWSFLGRTPDSYHSLSERPGWLRLSPSSRSSTTVIKNDGEHQYSLITRLDFEATSRLHEAGLWILNGPEDLQVKLVSSTNTDGEKVVRFSFNGREYEEENTIGSTLWLKLERDEHDMYGFFSEDGDTWFQVGNRIDATELNVEQTDFNSFTGNQQGLYVYGNEAFFDLYIYRDAYSFIDARHPVNHSGVEKESEYLGEIHNGDWALFAGVEFGDETPPSAGFDYQRTPDELKIEGSSASNGGTIEVWLDSIGTGQKIAEQTIENTGSWDTWIEFTAQVDSISGRHDVYLYFTGNEGEELFRLKQFRFTPKRVPLATSNEDTFSGTPDRYKLQQNYPNPFNPTTEISYQLPKTSMVSLKVYDMLGREVAELVNHRQGAGSHQARFDASNLSSGMYIYRLKAGSFIQTRKMMLIK